jgi:hypothetical protein
MDDKRSGGGQPTPDDLAQELGTTGRQVRAFLRARHPRSDYDHGARWDLTADQVIEVRARFSTRAGGRLDPPAQRTPTRTVRPGRSASGSYHDKWIWEGNVQRTMRAYLLTRGWTILREADTASKEPGDDLVATRDGVTMVVEVKGYPSHGYADPRRAGEVKRTSPTNQADHWFAQAILRCMTTIDRQPPVTVAVAFPSKPRYRSLLARTWTAIWRLGIAVFLVNEDLSVHQYKGLHK